MVKNCIKGKKCGRSCISKKYKCHKDPVPTPAPAEADDVKHTIPVTFHIVTGREIDLEYHYDCLIPKSNPTKCSSLKRLLQEINKIFKQTNVMFKYKSCKKIKAKKVTASDNEIADTLRGSETLFDKAALYDIRACNIFIVPLIGQRVMGYNAMRRGVRHGDTWSGSYTLISTYNLDNCTPYQMKETAITLAHELVHDLGVKHHSGQRDNLMYKDDEYNGTKLNKSQIGIINRNAPIRYPTYSENRTREDKLFEIDDDISIII